MSNVAGYNFHPSSDSDYGLTKPRVSIGLAKAEMKAPTAKRPDEGLHSLQALIVHPSRGSPRSKDLPVSHVTTENAVSAAPQHVTWTAEHEGRLSELLAMGFNRSEAMQALAINRGKIEDSIEYLLRENSKPARIHSKTTTRIAAPITIERQETERDARIGGKDLSTFQGSRQNIMCLRSVEIDKGTMAPPVPGRHKNRATGREVLDTRFEQEEPSEYNPRHGDQLPYRRYMPEAAPKTLSPAGAEIPSWHTNSARNGQHHLRNLTSNAEAQHRIAAEDSQVMLVPNTMMASGILEDENLREEEIVHQRSGDTMSSGEGNQKSGRDFASQPTRKLLLLLAILIVIAAIVTTAVTVTNKREDTQDASSGITGSAPNSAPTPTFSPSESTSFPTQRSPTENKTPRPLSNPTHQPSLQPTLYPTGSTPNPSQRPTPMPTPNPTSSTANPTRNPTPIPTPNPTRTTANPTRRPTPNPTRSTPNPTRRPRSPPTPNPTSTRTTANPTRRPTPIPTPNPTRSTPNPTRMPRRPPTPNPTSNPCGRCAGNSCLSRTHRRTEVGQEFGPRGSACENCSWNEYCDTNNVRDAAIASVEASVRNDCGVNVDCWVDSASGSSRGCEEKCPGGFCLTACDCQADCSTNCETQVRCRHN